MDIKKVRGGGNNKRKQRRAFPYNLIKAWPQLKRKNCKIIIRPF